MDSTQEHLPVKDIKDDIVLLKDGSMAVIIQTSAVNFGLLSENEQLAIISAFAGLLNSLSFMIQVVIRSKRLDISSYLHLLDESLSKQSNLLLAELILRYRGFIESIIRENEVLDKKFYIVIPVSYLELGVLSKDADAFAKALNILLPRRDHVIRQLARIGLKATQLSSRELIELFYDIYNGQSQLLAQYAPQEVETPPALAPTPVNIQRQSSPPPVVRAPDPQPARPQQPQNIINQPQVSLQPAIPRPFNPPGGGQSPSSRIYPQITAVPQPAKLGGTFVVEELPEEYGVVR